MVLFVHGLGATSSFWLPQIRGLFNLDQSYSDQYLLDLFTISLPGHPGQDRKFDLKSVQEQIREFAKDKGPVQSELAKKLVLTHSNKQIRALQEPKLILVGHSLGGAISLVFSLENPSWVSKIVLIACGNKFNTFSETLYYDLFLEKIILKLKLNQIKFLMKLTPNLKTKVMLDILVENPKRQGFLSGLKLVHKYNFERDFKKISLNQQLQFMKIPILALQGKYDMLSTIGSARKLGQLLSPENPVFKAKKTIIKTGKAASNFTLKEYSTGHHPMDDDLVSFVYDVRNFIDN